MFILKNLPLSVSLALGRGLGNIAYFFDVKQRRIGYSNLKAAFSYKKEPGELKKILKGCYKNLGLMIAEIAKFPKLNSRYIQRYIKISGFKEADRIKNEGRGVIFLTAHFGNWELSAQVAGIKNYPMKVLAREQRHTKINDLLNSYRSMNNCEVITKGFSIKSILRSLKDGQILGMLGDQSTSKGGVLVDFLGRKTYTPQGPISIARKTKAEILPSFIIRKKGPKHSILIHKPLRAQVQKDTTSSSQGELQEFHNQLADYIDKDPEQWLWMQKKWKFTPTRSILILNDGKAGHLNQAKAAAELLKEQLEKNNLYVQSPYAKEKGYKIINIRFKNRFSRIFLNSSALFSTHSCQGCMKCLKRTLEESCYREVISNYADYIISCGSSAMGLNLFLSKENNAKSIIIMKPAFKIKSFDLAIIPEHDRPKPLTNVVVTDGAPSVFNRELIDKDKEILAKEINLTKERKIGLFFGGSNASYKYKESQLKAILSQIKKATKDLDAELLVTTSRRTGSFFESLIKESLVEFRRCKLLVLAGQNNPPYAVGGILGLSDIVLVSFDSISMISEAVNSKKYVVVAVPDDYSPKIILKKHRRMIEHFNRKGYIHITNFSHIEDKIKQILKLKPEIKILKDNQKISRALSKLI